MTNAPAAPLLPPRLTTPPVAIPTHSVPTELDVPAPASTPWLRCLVSDQRDGNTVPVVAS